MKLLAKMPRKFQILIALIIVLLLGFFVFRFLPIKPINVPDGFVEARNNASQVSDEIVKMSEEGVKNLEQISSLDGDKKYSEALILVAQEIERNRSIRDKAISLSGNLELMTKAIPKITPSSAGQSALEAITSETILISKLINYNDYLIKLLESLRDKFMGVSKGEQVPELLQKINNEAKEINDLNNKFNNLMKKFDNSI